MRRLAGRLRQERGWTIVELTLAGSLMLIILSAALVTLNGAERTTDRNQKLNFAQGRVRDLTDQLARQLRNLASPLPSRPNPIDRARTTDLIFLTIDPTASAPADTTATNSANIMRVRYCLDSSDPRNGKLYVQEQRWSGATPPNAPPSDACPGTGTGSDGTSWSATRMVADKIVNLDGEAQPLFAFDSATDAGCGAMDPDTDAFQTACRSKIHTVRTKILLNPKPELGRREQADLHTAVAIRNQNEPPTCRPFLMTQVGSGGTQLLLDGSESSDPEGDSLQYVWYDTYGSTSINAGSRKLGTGRTFTTNPLTTGQHTIALRCFDLAGLYADAPIQTVNIG